MERKLDSKFYTNSLTSDGLYTDRTKTLLLVVDIQPKLMVSVEAVSYTHLRAHETS